MNKKLSKSIRKFIREEKARIRRELLSFKAQEEKISQLYQGFAKKKDKIVIKKPIEQKIEV